MDPREPQPPHPHTHHRQLKNMALVGPNPFTNSVSNTMVEPTNARIPPSNNVMSNLDSSVKASFGSSSIKKKRGRPRKYFPDGNITLGSSSVPTHNAVIISPSFNNINVMSNLDSNVKASFGSSSIKKKRGRPRKYFVDGNITLGSSSIPTQNATIISPSFTTKKNQPVEVLGMLKKIII